MRVATALGAPVVAIVGKTELRAQKQHAPVEQEGAAVVAHAAMDYWHAHVYDDACAPPPAAQNVQNERAR